MEKVYENYKGPPLFLAVIVDYDKFDENNEIKITDKVSNLYTKNNNWNNKIYTIDDLNLDIDLEKHIGHEIAMFFESKYKKYQVTNIKIVDKTTVINPPLFMPVSYEIEPNPNHHYFFYGDNFMHTS